jgi:hypothetical protein
VAIVGIVSLDAGFLAAGLVVALGCGQDAPTRGSEQEEVAEAAARSWLAIVDAGDYDESWHRASELFRLNMARFGKDVSFWTKSLGVSRSPLGEVRSRKTTHVDLKSGPPPLIEIVYTSAFAQADDVRETIVMTFEDDGEWRMASYEIERLRP